MRTIYRGAKLGVQQHDLNTRQVAGTSLGTNRANLGVSAGVTVAILSVTQTVVVSVVSTTSTSTQTVDGC